jgi:hypothetical protein
VPHARGRELDWDLASVI